MQFRDIKQKVHGFKNYFIIHKLKKAGNKIEIDRSLMGNISLQVIGTNNFVRLANVQIERFTALSIRIYGDNNTVDINGVKISIGLKIAMGHRHPDFGKITGAVFSIQPGSSIESLTYGTPNANAFCHIGKNCMFSDNITLYNTDSHPVISLVDGQICNWVDGIRIGDHCWIGHGVTILKNSRIPDDCIIGYNSVVCGKFNIEHAAYAGNPAKLIKTGITWTYNGAKLGFIKNEKGGNPF